jgi:hypothetical protein
VKDFLTLPSPTNQILRLETEEAPGSKVFLICNANSFFFSEGLKWAFQDSRDSEYNFHDDGKLKLSYNNCSSKCKQVDFITVISQGQGKVSLSMKKTDVEGKIVYCFAPVWNSNEWKNTSIFLDGKWNMRGNGNGNAHPDN